MLQWTTPAMLAGAVLIALPLIAHWLNRSSRRSVVFPTLRFLAAVTAAENRWLKLRRLFLLLLRCLAVLLVVAAFARPVWLAQPGGGEQDAKRLLVVVLDNSVSTAQVNEGTTVHGRLLAATQRLLSELTPGRDEAHVILAEARPRPLLRRPTGNLDYLQSELHNLKPSMERADLEAALNAAAAVLIEQPAQVKKQVLVLSDLQNTNWQDGQRISGQDLSLPADCQFRIVDLGLSPVGNIALSRPNVLPRDPLPGQACQWSVTVHNYSSQVQQAPVTLLSGGIPLGAQTVALDPWQSQIVTFAHAFDADAGRQFEFQVPADALLADNQAYIYLQPGHRVPVAMMSDDLINQPGSSAFFLDRALQPFASDADRFAVKSWRPRDLELGTLSGYRAVVVGNVREWGPVASQELVRFVRAGGRLLYFCGGGNVPRGLAAIEQAAGGPVFPFLVRDYQRWQQFEQMPAIQQGQWRGRWLREFDLASQFALQQIRFPAAWSVGEIRPDSEVIMSFADDRPALAFRSLGSGAILQANLSPGIEAGEFGKYAAFAALVQILVRQFLEESVESPAQTVGNPLIFETPLATQQGERAIIDPSGQTVAGRDFGDSDALSQTSLEAVTQVGFYSLRVGGRIVETTAVNIDARESDLRRLSSQAVSDLQSKRGSIILAAGSDTRPSIIDDGYSLWAWLMGLGMVALLIESLLVGVWRR